MATQVPLLHGGETPPVRSDSAWRLASFLTARNIQVLRLQQAQRNMGSLADDTHAHAMELPSAWRTSTRVEASAAQFVAIGNSLSGRSAVEDLEEQEKQAPARPNADVLALLWCLSVCAIVVFAVGSAFFVSSAYYDPVKRLGTKAMLLYWFNATAQDADESFPAHARPPSHAIIADPAFFAVFLTPPIILVAVINDVAARRHEGTEGRARVAPLRWARSPLGFRSLCKGEALFVVVLVVTNVSVFISATTAQFSWAMQGWDVDHLDSDGGNDEITRRRIRNNALKGIANAFGYCAIVSLAFIFMILARPVTDFLMTDVFGLAYWTSRVYYKRIGIWIGLASIFHIAFYLRPYAVEGVLLKRLLFFISHRQEAIANPHARVWLEDRDAYLGLVILFGEIAFCALAAVVFVAVFARTIREQAFEVYQFAHISGGIVVLVSLQLHYSTMVWWLLPWLALLGVQIVSTHANHRHPVRVIDFAPLRNGIIRLVLAANNLISLSSEMDSLAGKFVYVCLPSVRRMQWHAVYVASSRTASPTSITLYIKSRGRWSRGAYLHAGLCRQRQSYPLVYVDGFYGGGVLDRLLASSYVLLIGDGDVHAPYVLSVFQELFARYIDFKLPSHIQHIKLIWTTEDLCFLKELEPMLRLLQRVDPRGDVLTVQLFLSKQPCEEDQELFTDRTPLCHFASKQFAASRLRPKDSPKPFHRALHSSRAYLIVSKLLMTGGLALLLYLVRLQAHDHAYWVLVRVAEIGMIVVAGSTTLLLVGMERRIMSTVLRDSDCATDNEDEQQLKNHKAVASGFDVIGSYEYESGLGFMEEYGVEMETERPSYKKMVDDFFKMDEKSKGLNTQSTHDVSVEIAAPDEKTSLIVSDLKEAGGQSRRLHIHVEEVRV